MSDMEQNKQTKKKTRHGTKKDEVVTRGKIIELTLFSVCRKCFCDIHWLWLHCVQNRMSARGGKKKATKLSRSARAGVIFPVGRMMRYLRTGTHKYRIGMGAPVYMAAVIEYLAGRVALHDSSLIHANNIYVVKVLIENIPIVNRSCVIIYFSLCL